MKTDRDILKDWSKLWLQELDERSLFYTRLTRWEVVAEFVVAVVGMAFFGWSPIPVMMFMLLALWTPLLELLVLAVIDRSALETIESVQGRLEDMSCVVANERDGETPKEKVSEGTRLSVELFDKSNDRPLSLLAVTLMAVLWMGSITASFYFELHKTADLDLIRTLIERPDLILAMSTLLCVRIFSSMRRRSSSGPSVMAAHNVMPSVDMVVFFALFFIWHILSAIGLELQTLYGWDRHYVVSLVFIVVGYGLALWRSQVESKVLKDITADMEWIVGEKMQM
ncbi:MAG: hypothetical protein AAF662_14225 [Pseudomonadota bacterium]